MILVALGSNQPGPWGSPEATLIRALGKLNRGGLRLKAASRLLMSSPFGVTNQPDFVNAVAMIETLLSPRQLLARLHHIERLAGRRRQLRWGPRTLDLDLLDYNGIVTSAVNRPRLPHPGIARRIFVLAPIAEIAPLWRHPVTHHTAATMLKRLDSEGQGSEVTRASPPVHA